MNNLYITQEEYMQLIDLLKIEFNRIDENFDQIDKRFDQLSNQMNDRFVRIEQQLDHHSTRLNSLEKQLLEKVDKGDFKTLITVLKAGNIINRHEADHFFIPLVQ